MTGDKQHDATAEFNEALAAGFAARNFEGIGPFYTEDARLMPPRGKFLDGRGSAAAFWLGVANRYTSTAFTTVDLKALGDTVRRETGTYMMGSADGQATQGKYVFVWQLVEGEWQIESSIWNRNAEPASGGRRSGEAQGQRQGGGQGMGGQGAGGRGVGGQGGGYRQGGGGGQGGGGYRRGGAGQGGYRQGGGGQGGQGGGYGQGGGRPSFQTGGSGLGGGGGGGRRQGGGQGGGRQGGGGQGGGGQGTGAGGGLYDPDAGLYSSPKD